MANRTRNVGKGVKHGENLVQRTRAAILNTFDAVESKGRKLSAILAEEFERNPLKFMEVAIKAMPKEVTGEVNHNHRAADLTDDQLANIATGSSKGTASEAESAKSVH